MAVNHLQTISIALRWGAETLGKAKIPRPRREADLLLQHCLQKAESTLLLSPDLTITPAQSAQFTNLIVPRAAHEPLAYLTKQVQFCGLTIKVNKYVLIPRPETELLIEIIKSDLQSYNLPNLKVAEIGTGSGAIAITLTSAHPELTITATDISPAALTVAQQNISLHKLEKQVILKKGSLLEPFSLQSLDIIIANLPYIPSSELSKLELDVINYEPILALDGGTTGLQLISQLLQQSASVLRPHGRIYLETWHTHAKPLQYLVNQYLPGKKLTIQKDLSGLPRFAIIK